jgi:hypothetical protein
LATAGIVVGAVVVAAAIGIWVFRKWMLSVRQPLVCICFLVMAIFGKGSEPAH